MIRLFVTDSVDSTEKVSVTKLKSVKRNVKFKNKIKMSAAEMNAKSIMSRELGYEYETSYQRLCQLNFTGYTHSYLRKTANFKQLTTTAKLSVVLELAEYDLLWIENFRLI